MHGDHLALARRRRQRRRHRVQFLDLALPLLHHRPHRIAAARARAQKAELGRRAHHHGRTSWPGTSASVPSSMPERGATHNALQRGGGASRNGRQRRFHADVIGPRPPRRGHGAPLPATPPCIVIQRPRASPARSARSPPGSTFTSPPRPRLRPVVQHRRHLLPQRLRLENAAVEQHGRRPRGGRLPLCPCPAASPPTLRSAPMEEFAPRCLVTAGSAA